MRIYLIGMPGAGKSSVGRALAEKLNYTFIDLDHQIEEKAQFFIEDIFKFYGEETFRNLETEALAAINLDHCVIATGGGVVMKKRNKALMDGLKIYLDVPVELLKVRLDQSPVRPLLKEISIDDLYDKRFLKYQDFADIVIGNHDSIEKTVTHIREAMSGRVEK